MTTPQMPRGRVNDIVAVLVERVDRLEARHYAQQREQQRLEDARARRLVVNLAEIDRSVREYHQKVSGELPWAELLPPNLVIEEAA